MSTNDPSIIYNGNWLLSSGETHLSNGQPGEVPVQSAISNISRALLQFNSKHSDQSSFDIISRCRLQGTQVAVVGEIPPGQSSLVANYSIDDGEPVMKKEPALLGQNPSNITVLFTSDTLAPGAHTLDIGVLQTTVNRSFTLWAFFVKPSGNDSQIEESQGDNHRGIHTHANAGAIVGSVIGGLALLLLLTIGIVHRYRRRRSHPGNSEADGSLRIDLDARC